MPNHCAWADGDPLMRDYHDREWGVPEHDGRVLWEKLVLDGFQAGLSWLTILRKRDAFRAAFAGFDPRRVARFGDADVDRLLADAGIVRSRAKILAAVGNARAYLAMADAGEPFGPFVWTTVGGRPVQGTGVIAAQTPLSTRVATALKKRDFQFVGPTIVHAWLQAAGLVNDHAPDCFRRDVVRRWGEQPFPTGR